MSNHNYSQYSNHKKNNRPVEQVVEQEAVETIDVMQMSTEPVEEVVETVETVETVTLPQTVTGTVIECAKLNVRATASINADVVCQVDVGSELVIDTARSNNEWLRVCTPIGMEGYCMRRFVKATL